MIPSVEEIRGKIRELGIKPAFLRRLGPYVITRRRARGFRLGIGAGRTERRGRMRGFSGEWGGVFTRAVLW